LVAGLRLVAGREAKLVGHPPVRLIDSPGDPASPVSGRFVIDFTSNLQKIT